MTGGEVAAVVLIAFGMCVGGGGLLIGSHSIEVPLLTPWLRRQPFPVAGGVALILGPLVFVAMLLVLVMALLVALLSAFFEDMFGGFAEAAHNHNRGAEQARRARGESIKAHRAKRGALSDAEARGGELSQVRTEVER